MCCVCVCVSSCVGSDAVFRVGMNDYRKNTHPPNVPLTVSSQRMCVCLMCVFVYLYAAYRTQWQTNAHKQPNNTNTSIHHTHSYSHSVWDVRECALNAAKSLSSATMCIQWWPLDYECIDVCRLMFTQPAQSRNMRILVAIVVRMLNCNWRCLRVCSIPIFTITQIIRILRVKVCDNHSSVSWRMQYINTPLQCP